MNGRRAAWLLTTWLLAAALCLGACGGAASDLARPADAGWASYTLYTHCGIDQAFIAGAWYRAETRLDDGNGNPPAGWGNPGQLGRVRPLSTGRMEFADDAGHHVIFIQRVGATAPAYLCS